MATARGMLRWVGRNSKRVLVTILGFILVLGGIVLLPLPGPGMLIIIAGLAVLSSEYLWARRALDLAKEKARQAAAKVRRRKGETG
ncbi:MAG: PGPGW domain-containing protein [Actinomycetota bacterium]